MTALLRGLAAKRFPDVELGAEVDRIRDLSALERLCLELDQIPDPATLQARLATLAANGRVNGRA